MTTINSITVGGITYRKQRDMTAAQFAAALARYGMREAGFMGYVNIGVPGHHIEVSKLNAGSQRRNQLAYLLRERDRAMAELPCGHIEADRIIPVYADAKKAILLRMDCCKCANARALPAPPTVEGEERK